MVATRSRGGAAAMLRDRHDAADAVQEAFVAKRLGQSRDRAGRSPSRITTSAGPRAAAPDPIDRPRSDDARGRRRSSDRRGVERERDGAGRGGANGGRARSAPSLSSSCACASKRRPESSVARADGADCARPRTRQSTSPGALIGAGLPGRDRKHFSAHPGLGVVHRNVGRSYARCHLSTVGYRIRCKVSSSIAPGDAVHGHPVYGAVSRCGTGEHSGARSNRLARAGRCWCRRGPRRARERRRCAS